MPSYQTTACKPGADGKIDLVASHEFEAADTVAAKAESDAWSSSRAVATSGATGLRLFAGRVLLSERALTDEIWQDQLRS